MEILPTPPTLFNRGRNIHSLTERFDMANKSLTELLGIAGIQSVLSANQGRTYIKNDLLLTVEQFSEFISGCVPLKSLKDNVQEVKIPIDTCVEGSIASLIVAAKKDRKRVGVLPISDPLQMQYAKGVNIADLNDLIETSLVKMDGKWTTKEVVTGYSFKLTFWNQQ